MPHRLKTEDQKLLYEVLKDIWETEAGRVIGAYNRQTRIVMMVFCIVSTVALATTFGVLMRTRRTVSQTAQIVAGLQSEITHNRANLQAVKERVRENDRSYDVLRNRCALLELKVLRYHHRDH